MDIYLFVLLSNQNKMFLSEGVTSCPLSFFLHFSEETNAHVSIMNTRDGNLDSGEGWIFFLILKISNDKILFLYFLLNLRIRF